MFLDYGVEYDAAFEEFKNDNVLKISNGPYWISVHTKVGQKFMYDTFGITMCLHSRMRFNHNDGTRIWNILRDARLSGTYGGFYWLDKEHTKHIGQ